MAYLAGDELFEDLPSDGKQAYIEFVTRIEVLMAKDQSFHVVDYIRLIDMFCEIFDLKNVAGAGVWFEWNSLPSGDATEYFGKLRHDILYERTRYQLEIGREKALGAFDQVELETDAKQEIRSLVDKIKSKLDKIDLPVVKKDALQTKLNSFLKELDKQQTRLVALTSSMVQVASATGEAAEKLEPVVSLFERIMKAVGKGSKETKSLPKWEEQQQLPAPPKQIEDHSAESEPEISNENEVEK